jgi:hypothetical protein
MTAVKDTHAAAMAVCMGWEKLVAKQQGMDILELPSNSSSVVTCTVSVPLPVWSKGKCRWLLWATFCPSYMK